MRKILAAVAGVAVIDDDVVAVVVVGVVVFGSLMHAYPTSQRHFWLKLLHHTWAT